jgi:hypothetical protein
MVEIGADKLYLQLTPLVKGHSAKTRYKSSQSALAKNGEIRQLTMQEANHLITNTGNRIHETGIKQTHKSP